MPDVNNYSDRILNEKSKGNTSECLCHTPLWEKIGRVHFSPISDSFAGTICCSKESVVVGIPLQTFRCKNCRRIKEVVVGKKVVFCIDCRRRIDIGA